MKTCLLRESPWLFQATTSWSSFFSFTKVTTVLFPTVSNLRVLVEILCSTSARMVLQSCDVSQQSAHLLILTTAVSRIWVICLSLSWMKRLPSSQITTATTHYTKQWLANIPTYFQRNIKPNSGVHTLCSLCAQMFRLQDCARSQRQHSFIIHNGE